MAKADKLVQKMKNNPLGFTIENFRTAAKSYGGLIVKEGKGSHVIFMTDDASLSVPARRPIKPVYVKLFLELIEGKK